MPEPVTDAIRKAAAALWGDPERYAADVAGDALGVREDLLAVLRHLPRGLTVGEMLTELEAP
jgi:hypothetical protein